MEQGASLHEEGQKSSLAFRTISEVSQEIDVPQHVLRFWESRFTQIRPLKRGGGRRYYRPEDIELLRCIKNYLYKQGYTIKGVQRILKETRRAIVTAPGPSYSRDTDLAQDVRPEDFSKDFGEGFTEATQMEEAPVLEGAPIERALEAVETIHNEIENPPQPMRVDAEAAATVEAVDRIDPALVADPLLEDPLAAEALPPVNRPVPEAALAELREIHTELVALRDMLRGEAA